MNQSKADTLEPMGPDLAASPGELVADFDENLISDLDPQISRMRCPACQKLYSVDSETLRIAGPTPRFDCVGCGSRFGVLKPHGPEVQIEATTLETFIDENSVAKDAVRRKSPAMARSSVQPVPVKQRECPKCKSETPQSLHECQNCGIVFARFRPGEDERVANDIQLAGRRDLIAHWEAVMNDYTNESKHETFIASCRRAQCLPFAAFSYSRILSATPDEEIAKKMRNRIIGFASFAAEPQGEPSSMQFRIPGFNALAIFLASFVFFLGFFMPGAGSLRGVGFAMLCLSLGVRYYLRPRD